MKNLTDEIISTCVYVCVSMYICIHTHTYTHISVQIFLKAMGMFALIHVDEWGTSSPYPSLTFSPPYLTSSQAPPLPSLLHTGVTLWKWSSREGYSLTQLPVQSCLNVLFPVSVISPVVSKLPREKEQRSGVYRMSVFKVTLCISHSFFFFKEKSTGFFGGG